jgi:hypothetical protein
MRFLAPAILTLLTLLATWKLTLGERIIARGDLLLYFYPLRDFAAAALRDGHLPLWNPYTFMGSPFLANSQVGFFYPFNLLSAWLPAERAIALQIPLHLIIAGLGMYVLARRGMALSRLAAFASALAFGLGGYLGAQIEHINQVQVLAWLPLEVFWVAQSKIQNLKSKIQNLALLSLVIAFQVAAGHTQSLYICLVTLGVVALGQCLPALIAAGKQSSSQRLHPIQPNSPWANALPIRPPTADDLKALLRAVLPLLLLGMAAALGALLSAAQLVPTLELSQFSARGARMTLSEAGSFSWRPWVFTRALMPTYGDPLFAEYVAYIGAGGLALMLIGVVAGFRKQRPSAHFPLAFTLLILGLLLAWGMALPSFPYLYRYVPGFSQFRVQARWLIMFSLGAAMLIGLGADYLRFNTAALVNRKSKIINLVAWFGLMAVLGGLAWWGVRFSPEAEYKSWPANSVLWGWGLGAAAVTVLLLLPDRLAHAQQWGLIAVMATELLVASQFQPYARAADGAALTSLRPATAHLLAQKMENGKWKMENLDEHPNFKFSILTSEFDRILSLSGLFFDPGDKDEQTLIYESQLSADELYDRIIASKQKEILTPNFSLYYRLPSVDGYDGGLLPTRQYADFVRQIIPPAPVGSLPRSVDGRLREFLKGVPEQRWLDQMGVRYVLTDKTTDVFIEDVYYDTLFSSPIVTRAGSVLTFPLSPYTATSLGILLAQPAPPYSMTVLFADGASQQFEGVSKPFTPANTGEQFGYVRLDWGQRRTPSALFVHALGNAIGSPVLRSLSSIDHTDKTFISQMLQSDAPDGHNMRMVYSGDTKIYENLSYAGRATLSAERKPHNAALHTQGLPAIALPAQMLIDQAERVLIKLPALSAPSLGGVSSDPFSYTNVQLTLHDSCYPGWLAYVDGVETPITCPTGIARVVNVLPGAQQVEFVFRPISITLGFVLSGVGVLLWLGLVVVGAIYTKKQSFLKSYQY